VRTFTLLSGLALSGLAMCLGQWSATALSADGNHDGGVASGPDVIVGAIPDVARYAPATWNGVEYAAYAIGSTSCNIGTQRLLWIPNPDPRHPVIPQNMYRVKDGAIEQIGMSWVKHGFCALQQNLCGPCQSAGWGCPYELGIGCSDPYTASLNGAQGDLKSRGPINPTTGVFQGNYEDPTPPQSQPSSLRERIMVAKADLDPAANSGAVYFAEAQYVHPQDAAAGNALNNASYRRLLVESPWSNQLGYPLTLTGPTIQLLPAIYAWATVHNDVGLRDYDVPGDGRFTMGFRTWPNQNGTWHYEYAIFNLNSDRCGGSFSIPVPAGVVLSNVGFKSPMYHSGDPYENVPWTATLENGMLTWRCAPHTNPNANALRWSTMYNFRFDANVAPAAITGEVRMGLWKAPTPTSPAEFVPMQGAVPSAPSLPADRNGDGVVDGTDLAAILACWGTPCGDISGDGTTDGIDLGSLLAAWTG
jgi:hypothetical protein